jgi:hypothetical protein
MPALLDQVSSALSVTPTCPRCKGVIPSADINVLNDIAYCRTCNLSHSLSGLTSGITIDPEIDLSRPPAGTWFRRESLGPVIGASHRSLGQAFGLLGFCLFWNGIVSVFVLLAITATLQHLGVHVPQWFPSPSSHGKLLPIGMTIFLWLFLTPFIAVGVAMVATLLSCLGGATELRIQGGAALLFTGIGPLGFRKRFSTSDVKDVRIEEKRWTNNDGRTRRNEQIVIELNSGKKINFGSMLNEERRLFVAGAVRKTLLKR